ncbi:hypothetical protein ABT061_25515 [Streptosporangium sp. NPDC002544]|uniref:hypothetical protein n=1 Tax=Streptosporangium sp. NPDC002544 TaxID=3154538 RepID=UPI003319903E
MGVVHRIRAERQVPVLKDAVEEFLAGVSNSNTIRSYATALRALATRFGSFAPVIALEGEMRPTWSPRGSPTNGGRARRPPSMPG